MKNQRDGMIMNLLSTRLLWIVAGKSPSRHRISLLTTSTRCHASSLVDKMDHDLTEMITCPIPVCVFTWCKKCSLEVPGGDASKHSCDGTKELDALAKNEGWKICPVRISQPFLVC